MLIAKIFFAIFVVLGALYWIVQLVCTLRLMASVRTVDKLPYKNLKKWPRISVIIPARNEADTIEAAMRSRLESDYPNLEIILIDDRSTDNTPEIIEEIAQTDNRVKAIHIKELPEAWIGKLYAMHTGAKVASGAWLLFSDADVHIASGTLKRVISYCELHGYDHIAAIPQLYPTTFLLDSVLSVFMRHICLVGRPWKVKDKTSKASIGAGAFNLVRRTAYVHAQGFERIRLTVVDDIALGRVLKESGAHCTVVNGRNSVGLHFYHSLREMMIGSERALFTMVGQFSMIKLIVIGLLMLGFEISPFIALVPMGLPFGYLVGTVMLGIMFLTAFTMNMYLGRPWWTAFFVPLAVSIMFIAMVRAGILGKSRGGIIWRGTFYPTNKLKQYRQY